MITIAGNQLRTHRPADLDKVLVASTGFGAHEIDTLLAAGPDRAARALAPFLEKDAPTVRQLARDIARDPDAIQAIRGLYAPEADTAADKAVTTTGKAGDKAAGA